MIWLLERAVVARIRRKPLWGEPNLKAEDVDSVDSFCKSRNHTQRYVNVAVAWLAILGFSDEKCQHRWIISKAGFDLIDLSRIETTDWDGDGSKAWPSRNVVNQPAKLYLRW